jgi:hypothetical protein|nr:MAG TPA: hypothetical protein [Caudoviricetes sp.]
METKELKIQVPEGYKIDKKNSTFEKIVFKKVENELPKSWEDLYEVGGWFVDFHSKVVTSGSMRTADSVKNRFPTKEEAEACLALAQLCQLRDRYNDGWKPDWEDDGQSKWCIEFFKGKIEKEFHYVTKRVLCFKTRELRDKFLENFRDLIETAKPLL